MYSEMETDKVKSLERYIASSLFLIASNVNPKGNHESSQIIESLNHTEFIDKPSAAVFYSCSKTWLSGGVVDFGTLVSGMKEFSISVDDLRDLIEYQMTYSAWEHQLEELVEIRLKKKIKSQLKSHIESTDDKTSIELKADIETILNGVKQEADKEVSHDQMEQDLFGDKTPMVPSGIEALDRALDGGFEENQIVVIGCRPSVGKSSVSCQMVTNRIKLGLKSIVFNMEMKGSKVISRVMAQMDNIPLSSIKNVRKLGPEIYSSINTSFQNLKDKIHIHDKSRVSIEKIKSNILSHHYEAELNGEDKPNLVVIDYLHLIEPPKHAPTDTTSKIGAISRELRILAEECKVCIVVLSQLSRDIEKREDKIPKSSDLRDSGAIEADANTIIFVHREAMYSTDYRERNQEGQPACLIITKNREGECGMVDLNYSPTTGSWR